MQLLTGINSVHKRHLLRTNKLKIQFRHSSNVGQSQFPPRRRPPPAENFGQQERPMYDDAADKDLGTKTLRWLGYGLAMFLLGTASSSVNEQIEKLDIWSLEEEYDPLYRKYFLPLGFCKFDFAQILSIGEKQLFEAGSFIYRQGAYDGENVFLILSGTAAFVLLEEMPDSINPQSVVSTVIEGKEVQVKFPYETNSSPKDQFYADSGKQDALADSRHDSSHDRDVDSTLGGDEHDDENDFKDEDVPAKYLAYGRLRPGQFDTLLCRPNIFKDNSQLANHNPSQTTSAVTSRHTSSNTNRKISQRIGMVAETPLTVFRIPRDKLESLLQRQRRLEVLSHRIDGIRQQRARELLAVQHRRMELKLKEYEDLVARRIIQLIKEL